jgi:hypothetical protein
LCKLTKTYLLGRFPSLKSDDIKVTSSGATGEDLQLSPAARAVLPVSIECKARHGIAVYEWLDQAVENAGDYFPMVVAKGDRREPIVIMYLEDFFNLKETNETN